MSSSLIAGLRPVAVVFVVSFAVGACGRSSQTIPTTALQPTLEPTSSSAPTLSPQPEITLDIKLPEGDPNSGYTDAIRFRCFGCHADPEYASFGPRFESSEGIPAISERGDLRIVDPNYEGRASTNREYIIESILLPKTYVVDGEWEEEMPIYFGDIIEDQDLADIIAWMATFE